MGSWSRCAWYRGTRGTVTCPAAPPWTGPDPTSRGELPHGGERSHGGERPPGGTSPPGGGATTRRSVAVPPARILDDRPDWSTTSRLTGPTSRPPAPLAERSATSPRVEPASRAGGSAHLSHQWEHPAGYRRADRDERQIAVSTTGPVAVMAMVCSLWAVREPSADRMVHPSRSKRMRPVPAVSQGSMARVGPGRSG